MMMTSEESYEYWEEYLTSLTLDVLWESDIRVTSRLVISNRDVVFDFNGYAYCGRITIIDGGTEHVIDISPDVSVGSTTRPDEVVLSKLVLQKKEIIEDFIRITVL